MLQRPQLLYGFEPVETRGDFDDVVQQFFRQNAAMFGLDASAGDSLAELTPGRIHFRCRRDEMEPLPAIVDGEYYEPSCPNVTIMKYHQIIDGVPFLDGSIGAVFDSQDRLTSLVGEFLGFVPVKTTFQISAETAIQAVGEHLQLSEFELFVDSAEGGFVWEGELTPAWRIRVHTRDFADLTVTVDADSGNVLRIADNVDHVDQWAWGNTLDNEAAYECNEPAFRHRDVNTAFQVGGLQAAFNGDVHVYDMETEASCGVDPMRSNDTYFSASRSTTGSPTTVARRLAVTVMGTRFQAMGFQPSPRSCIPSTRSAFFDHWVFRKTAATFTPTTTNLWLS
jgi:hypothetical protein